MTQVDLIPAAKSSIEFSVDGAPLPQGSKTAYVRGGRAVLVDVADKKTKSRPAGALKTWRNRIADAAAVEMSNLSYWEHWLGPVVLECEFVFKRPPSHFTSKGALTKSAPMIPQNDLDKLLRAVGDALTKVVYNDDVQVVGFGSSTKRFANSRQGIGGVYVKVRQA